MSRRRHPGGDRCQMNEWQKWENHKGAACVALEVCSDLSSFSQFQGILDVNPEVAHRAVNLCMAEQDGRP